MIKNNFIINKKIIKRTTAFALASVMSFSALSEAGTYRAYALSSDAETVYEELIVNNALSELLGSKKSVSSLQAAINAVSSTMSVTKQAADGDLTAGQIDPDEGNKPDDTVAVKFYQDDFVFNSINEDKDFYNESAEFTFFNPLAENDEDKNVTYQGLYNTNVKEDNNLELPLKDVGSVVNPYVILEITPTVTTSELRPHVGMAGFLDLTKEKAEAITLTDQERNQVNINAIQYLLEVNDTKIKKFTASEKTRLEKERQEQINALNTEIARLQRLISDENNKKDSAIELATDEQIALAAEIIIEFYNSEKGESKTLSDYTVEEQRALVSEFVNAFVSYKDVVENGTSKIENLYEKEASKYKTAVDEAIEKYHDDMRFNYSNTDLNKDQVSEKVKTWMYDIIEKAVIYKSFSTNPFLKKDSSSDKYTNTVTGEVYTMTDGKYVSDSGETITVMRLGDYTSSNYFNTLAGWGNFNAYDKIVTYISSAVETVDDADSSDMKISDMDSLIVTQSQAVREKIEDYIKYKTPYDNLCAASKIFEEIDANIARIEEQIAQKKAELETLKNTTINVTTKDLVTELNNRGTTSVESVIAQMKLYLVGTKVITQDELDKYINKKLDEAREYKIDYQQSIYNTALYSGQYKFDLDWKREYVVKDGKFVRYAAGSARDYDTPLHTDDNVYGNALYNEYKVTSKDVYNPLATINTALYGGSCNSGIKGILETDYAFRKSCLNLAYKTELDDAGLVASQEVCVDEYIFLGWAVNKDGALEPIENITDEELANYTELYTKWAVRLYEDTTFSELTFSDISKQYVGVEFGESDDTASYKIFVPKTIASCTNKNALYHDARNQITMCTPVSTNAVLVGNYAESENTWAKYPINYVEETSAWEFDFSKSKYNTVEKLQQVIPSLMADTDYYVKTYNTVVKADPNGGVKINYYPYNVQIVTATPKELNKMVYYDYSGKEGNAQYYSDGKLVYHPSDTINKFINNVDLIYFAYGSSPVSSLYVQQSGATVKSSFSYNTINTHKEVTENRISDINLTRVPELCKITDDDKLVFDPSKVDVSKNFQSGDASDLEWQVIEKIYSRTGDKTQNRRVAVIINEAFSDGVDEMGGTSQGTYAAQIKKDGKYVSGVESNLSKLTMMYFAFSDPTMFYDMYFDVAYDVQGKHFDKVKGVLRGDEPVEAEKNIHVFCDTFFTGALYDYQFWNLALFFPYEIFDGSEGFHKNILSSNDWYANFASQVKPLYYDAIGLARQCNFKKIANEYAYTFNGDTNLTQGLFQHNIDEVQNLTNDNANTYRAFDYFRKARPIEIQNGKIATKSAIEFMVQNAQNGLLSTEDRRIKILNAEPVQNMFTVNGVRFGVDKVMADEVGVPACDIHYNFTGSIGSKSILVTEYYWTYGFKNIDNDNRWGGLFYTIYTDENCAQEDKWYRMPDSSAAANAQNYFVTTVADTGTAPAMVTTNDGITTHVKIERTTPYSFNALLKPQIKPNLIDKLAGDSVLPTYVIVVKEYASEEAYRAKQSPKSVTTKNVIASRLSLLFDLD